MIKKIIGLGLLVFLAGCDLFGGGIDSRGVEMQEDGEPSLIDNNLGTLNWQQIVSVGDTVEKDWLIYRDDELGFQISYPKIWKEKIRMDGNPNVVREVSWSLGFVPENIKDYSPEWSRENDIANKPYAVLAYSVMVVENKEHLSTMQLFEMIARENLKPVEFFDICWTNAKVDLNYVTDKSIMIGGAEAMRTDWMTCPPGAGGRKEVVIADEKGIYIIAMTVTAPSGGQGDEWEQMFERFYQTFRLIE